MTEKCFVEVNGMRQGMFIDSRDSENPVLLVLHGGPGMPEHWLSQRYPTGLEDHVTTVWWEQRGAGLSYRPGIPPESMTVDQFVEDTIAVTRHLCARFDTDRVLLLGHSWGSYVGIRAIARAPDLYAAYIGVGQVVHQIESERLAYDHCCEVFARRGDARMLARLRRAPPSSTAPLPADYMRLRDPYMHRAGVGTMRGMSSVVTGIFLPSLHARDYTVRERVDLWRGKLFSRRSDLGLWDTMLVSDVRVEVPAVDVPAYFLHGRHDYTCAYDLAKQYVEQLTAPAKAFHTFERSAHSPLFEEPARTVEIVRTEVLPRAASRLSRSGS